MSWKPDVLNICMLLAGQKSFLSTDNLALPLVTWYGLLDQREFASYIEVAFAIPGEDLRSSKVWSIVYCGNNFTALCFRAFGKKTTGVEKKSMALRGSITPLQYSLHASWWDDSEYLSDESHLSFPPTCAAPDRFASFPWVCGILCLPTRKPLMLL